MYNPIRFRFKLTRLSRCLGFLVAIGAAVSLLLHAVDLPQADLVLPRVGVATAALLAGSALAFPAQGISNLQSRTRQGLALAALLAAAVSIVLYFQWDFPLEAARQWWMVRVNTSVLLLLLVTVAAVCVQHRRSVALAQLLAIVGVTFCLLAMIDYSEGRLSLTGLMTAFPIRIPSAVVVLGLSLSILLARPEVGPMAIVTSATRAGSLARRLLLPVILLPILLNFLFLHMTQWEGFGTGLERAVFVFTTMIVTVALVWWQLLTLYRSDIVRAELEEQVLKLDRRSALLVNSVTDHAIHTLDSAGHITCWNTGAEHISGYQEKDIQGQDFTRLFPPEAVQAGIPRQLLETARLDGRAVDAGWQVRKNGTRFYANTIINRVNDSQGTLLGFAVVTQDTTARKAAEDAVKRSETRLKLALAAGRIGVWDIDLTTDEVTVEGPIYETLAAPAGVKGYLTDWLELAYPADRDPMAEQLDQIVRGQREVLVLEHRMRTRHGAWRWMYSRGLVSARDHLGQVLGLHGASVDIHERKIAEEALRKSKRDLDVALKGAAFHLWRFHVREQRLEDMDNLIGSLGYSRTPATQTPDFWVSLLHPDDWAFWRTQPLWPLPEDLEGDGIELRLRAKDGSWRWMVMHARVVETDKYEAPAIVSGSCVDISARKLGAEQLLHAAQHDPLTELPNRALTYAFGERMLEAAPRHGGQCAILFIDLDRFKPINDNFGHAAGDEVLCEVARRLQRCVRSEDVVGRLGGDEFLVILAHVQKVEDITHIATNCLIALSHPIFHREFELQVSPSIGISLYPQNGEDMDTLVKQADTAMYNAKQNGGNTFRFFTPAMNAQAKRLYKQESRMRHAVEHEGFCLYYQPVVDTDTHRIASVEALLRWPSENIGPEEFIPLAESSGLILPLGDWALRQACRQQQIWVGRGMAPLKISVNVSPLQFRQEQFHAQVAATISETGIDPADLQLEITENAFLQDSAVVVNTLNALREMGISIALDDFGKGYSSLNYLKSLLLDVLKVDKDFIHELQTDKMNLAITEAIITLGASLGLQVIAEGIESEGVLQLLRTKHCHHMQGFFLSQPLPADEFETWYRNPLAPGLAYQH